MFGHHQSPCLIILDNHFSHVNFEVVTFCRSHGIVLLTLPPHTSHRLQPLDVAVFGPLKTYVNRQADGWMRTNPGRTMNIYDIPGIVGKALPLAAKYSNITAGFEATGVQPFNRDKFIGQFQASYVTDRENPSSRDDPDHLQDPEEVGNSADSSLTTRSDLPSKRREQDHERRDDSSGEVPMVPPVRRQLDFSSPRVSVGEIPGTSGCSSQMGPKLTEI